MERSQTDICGPVLWWMGPPAFIAWGAGVIEESRLSLMVQSFAEFGVSQERLVKRMGCPLSNISEPQLDGLRGLYRAIQTGAASVQELFPEKDSDPDDGTAELLARAKKARAEAINQLLSHITGRRMRPATLSNAISRLTAIIAGLKEDDDQPSATPSQPGAHDVLMQQLEAMKPEVGAHG